MGKLYAVGDSEVQAFVQEAINRWHPELKESGAYVLAIMVESNDAKPALAHSGYAALATARVVPEPDRVTKQHDAEIHIDGGEWVMMDACQRMALMDHELSHLSVKCKKQKKTYTGPPIYEKDQFGRPVLQLRKGDWNVGDGFRQVIERHGDAAAELENIRRAYAFAQKIAKGEV